MEESKREKCGWGQDKAPQYFLASLLINVPTHYSSRCSHGAFLQKWRLTSPGLVISRQEIIVDARRLLVLIAYIFQESTRQADYVGHLGGPDWKWR